MRSRWKLATVVAGVLLVSLPQSQAFAHGEKESTDPADGARLSRPPRTVSVSLSEAPGPGSSFKVSDGCSRSVVTGVDTRTKTGQSGALEAVIEGGEPGTWKARYRAISSIDGHETRDVFTFQVRGKKDCSRDEANEDEGTELGGGRDTRIAGDAEESTFPFVPLAAGTVVLVGVALVLRRRSSE